MTKPIKYIGHIDAVPHCQKCDKPIDGFTGDKKKPKDGDLSICAYCGTLAKYADNLTKIIPLTASEKKELDPDTWKAIQQAQKIIMELKFHKEIKNRFFN